MVSAAPVLSCEQMRADRKIGDIAVTVSGGRGGKLYKW